MATIKWANGVSGDWSDKADWSPALVPGSDDSAEIGPGISADAPWIVAATGEAAGSLLLAAGDFGTLAVAGSLAVGSTISVASGILLGTAGALISSEALIQSGGTVNLDGGTLTNGTGGADIGAGAAVVQDGGSWSTATLLIGAGVEDASSPGAGSVVLQKGSLGGSGLLMVSGMLSVGQDAVAGDGGSGQPGGVGTLTASGGSEVTALSLDIVNGSTVSVDAANAVVLGDAPVHSSAITVGTNATLTAEIGTIAANVVLAGALEVQQAPGGQPGDLSIGGSLIDTGNIEVASTSTLAVAGVFTVVDTNFNGPTFLLGAGGHVSDPSLQVTSDSIEGVGASTVAEVDGGTLTDTTAGSSITNSGVLLKDGGTWNAQSLSIGTKNDDNSSALVQLSAGTLTVASTLSIGFDLYIGPGFLGSSGTLDAGDGSRVTASSLILQPYSTVSLDATSSVVVGGAGLVAGAVMVSAGATLASDTGAITGDVVNDGSLMLYPMDSNGHVTVASLTISGSLLGTGSITLQAASEAQGGVLEVGSAHAYAGSIALQNSSTLALDAGDAPAAKITVASGTATIDLKGLAFPLANQPVYDAATGLVAVSGFTLDVGLGHLPGNFAIAPDDGNGTLLTVAAAPCFASDTRLLAEHGEVRVDALAPGDRVVTHAGSLHPVRWIGSRPVNCRRHPRPHDVWPIRVRAHAFGRGRPRRDLVLSPDHAVYDDGVLIPIRYLVNAATIRQEQVDEITYWHIELDRHDVILAEGMACESYLDTGNRAAFADGGPALQLHPDFALQIWHRQACAPLVCGGPRLIAAKRRLLARATALGHLASGDPGLKILAGGREVRAAVDGRQWRLRLPAATDSVRLTSHVWSPAHMRPDDDDTRRLGVAISRVWLDGREASLESDGFAAGWHAPESGWRWIDGDARLAIAGVRELAFEVALTGIYWREGPGKQRRSGQGPFAFDDSLRRAATRQG